jgi:hypothetical protein
MRLPAAAKHSLVGLHGSPRLKPMNESCQPHQIKHAPEGLQLCPALVQSKVSVKPRHKLRAELQQLFHNQIVIGVKCRSNRCKSAAPHNNTVSGYAHKT